MNIYFTAPLYRKEENIKYYNAIISVLRKDNHIIEDTLTSDADTILSESQEEAVAYYRTWETYVKKADFCVAEISFPGTVNIGFEIASIINRGKPVIAMFRKGTDPVFICPEFSNKIIKVEYTLDTIQEVLEWAVEEVKVALSRRFTFNISSKIDHYLDEITRNTGKNRSDFLRELIEERMEQES